MLLLAACVTPTARAPAAAHFPSRPLHLVVPFPAGGGADFWGRLIAAKMAEALGATVVVDNIPGSGGNDGTATVARAPADGYTLLLGSVGPLAVHPFTYAKLAFDPSRDFVAVSLLESSPLLLVVHPSVHAASLAELLALARAQPESVSFASNGNGSPEHVAGEVLARRAGVALRHVPSNGAGPARRKLLAGEVAMMFDPSKAALSAVREGRQRALAVASDERLAVLPEAPTFAEAGLPNFDIRIWTGILAPRETPAATVAILSRAIESTLATPEVEATIAAQGGTSGRAMVGGFAAFMDAERARWSKLVTESGVQRVASP